MKLEQTGSKQKMNDSYTAVGERGSDVVGLEHDRDLLKQSLKR